MRREDLEKVRLLQEDLKETEARLENLRGLRLSLTTHLNGMPKARKLSSRLEELTVKIMELEEYLGNLKAELARQKENLTEEILSAELDPALQRILLMRFVEGKSFRAIAKAMNYSLRHVFRMVDEFKLGVGHSS